MRIPGVGVALLFCTARLAAQPPLPIHHRTLANGLDVIVIENHAVPIVRVELDVKNGAFTQTPEYEGLSHLYEHMFFRANRTIPDQERYLERLRELGAVPNATTSGERVNYFVTVGTDRLVPVLEFMEDAIRFPLFRDEDLERERPIVLGEFDRIEASPVFHLSRAVSRELWSPTYASRKSAIGDRGVIASATREKMQAIQAQYYVPNNTALILAGAITPARGFALAERVFGDWPRGADPFAVPVPDPPPLERSKVVIVERTANTVTLRIAWQGPSARRDPHATYAADVLSEVLRDETTRFYKRVVGSGLALAVSFDYGTEDHVGPITLSAQTSPEKVVALHRVILEEVAAFGDPDYVTDEELTAARNRVAVKQVYLAERTGTLASVVGYFWAVAGLEYYLGYRANMQAVTRADIATYARTYLVGRPHVTGVLISPAARAATNLTPEALLNAAPAP